MALAQGCAYVITSHRPTGITSPRRISSRNNHSALHKDFQDLLVL
jgi:hypothetical protein